jgi:hypothetical protein
MERLLKHNIGVEMEIEILNKFYESQKVYNVIGEFPGTDKLLKDEIVLLGAHLDSWHGGTGAADNASGCIVMMEALRILKALGISPRRTIRVALWGEKNRDILGPGDMPTDTSLIRIIKNKNLNTTASRFILIWITEPASTEAYAFRKTTWQDRFSKNGSGHLMIWELQQ